MMLFPATIVFLFCVFPEITKADDPPERVVLRIGRTYTPVYNATKEHLATLRRGLAWLMPEVRRSILFIDILPGDSEHFQKKEAAHCHRPDDDERPVEGMRICFSRDTVTEANLWHEAGHAWLISMPTGFDEEWQEISDFAYAEYTGAEDRKLRQKRYPAAGLLSGYATTNYREDVAEWFSCIYEYVSGGKDAFAKITDRDDPCYLQKLRMLRDWGAIGAEDYNLIIKLFRSKRRLCLDNRQVALNPGGIYG